MAVVLWSRKKVCFQKICRHVSGNDSKWKILTHASGSGGVCLSRNTSVGATKKSSFFYMCSRNYVYHNDIIFKLQLWKKWPCSSVSLGKIVLKSNNQAMAVALSSSRKTGEGLFVLSYWEILNQKDSGSLDFIIIIIRQ